MSNTYGNLFRFTIWGQSHAPAIGVTIEGLPSGFTPDLEKLQVFLQRRAPGNGPLSTARREEDRPEFIAGLVNGTTCGAPVTAMIRNRDARSCDYDPLRTVPRPGHADYPAFIKFGSARDAAGGGQFSGRLTAPLCIAGGLALQLLEEKHITVSASIVSIAGENDPVKMTEAMQEAMDAGDSTGGIIECRCEGVPPGIGDPMFGGMENRISQAVFGIPAIKGVEFGDGFATSALHGSENNDPFTIDDAGSVRTKTNHAGGILGGITTGMPIVVRAAVKPTPSIAIEQDSVDLSTGKPAKLIIRGRHDPCIVPRAVPCVEAAVAAAVYDAIREAGA